MNLSGGFASLSQLLPSLSLSLSIYLSLEGWEW